MRRAGTDHEARRISIPPAEIQQGAALSPYRAAGTKAERCLWQSNQAEVLKACSKAKRQHRLSLCPSERFSGAPVLYWLLYSVFDP